MAEGLRENKQWLPTLTANSFDTLNILNIFFPYLHPYWFIFRLFFPYVNHW